MYDIRYIDFDIIYVYYTPLRSRKAGRAWWRTREPRITIE